MTISARGLAPDDWETWRAVRLAALAEAPEAFASTLDREQGYDEVASIRTIPACGSGS